MLEMVIKTGQTTEATRRQVGLLQKEPKEVDFTKSEKKKNSNQSAKKGPKKNLSHKGQNSLLQQRKNNRMQIRFLLALSRQLPCIQSNLLHLQKTQPLCKNVPLKQIRPGNHAGLFWLTGIRGWTSLCRLRHCQNKVTNTQTKNLWGKLNVRNWLVTLAVNGTKTRFKIDSVK